MSGKTSAELKEVARLLELEKGSRPDLLRKLVLDGFFDFPVSSKDIVHRIREKFGNRWETRWVHPNISPFLGQGLIQGLRLPTQSGHFWALSSLSREDAFRLIKGKGASASAVDPLFSGVIHARLAKDFSNELRELSENISTNGNATAFLLRKILEKLIIVAFAKNGREHVLADPKWPGGWVGLEKMIDIASQEKVSGIAFLIPATARKISGIKFLGDTAAHNPLANVDITTILPQLPFIITAYDELSKRI